MALTCPKCGNPLAAGAADQLDCPRCSSAVFLPALRTAPLAAVRPVAKGFDPRAFLAASGPAAVHVSPGGFFASSAAAQARALSPVLFMLIATGTAILFLGSALLFRAPFVEARPAPLFGMLGLQSDTAAALSIHDVEASRIVVGEQPILLLGGEVTNTGNREMPVPALRVSLNDGGDEIFAWTVQPEESTLAAGATLSFKSRVAAPAGAGSLEVSFVAPE